MCFARRFLCFFQGAGANSDVGRKDVTKGVQSDDDGLDETAPYILGKDVQVNIDSPYDLLRSIKYFVLQSLGDVCLLSLLSAVGSFIWIYLPPAVEFLRAKVWRLDWVGDLNQGLGGAWALIPGVLVVLSVVLVVLISTLVHLTMGASVFLVIGWLIVPLAFCLLSYLPAIKAIKVYIDVERITGEYLHIANKLARQVINTFVDALIPQFPQWISIEAKGDWNWQQFANCMPKKWTIIALFIPVSSVALICIELLLAAPECLHQWWMMLVMLLLTRKAWLFARPKRQETASPEQKRQTDESTQSADYVDAKTRQNTKTSEKAAEARAMYTQENVNTEDQCRIDNLGCAPRDLTDGPLNHKTGNRFPHVIFNSLRQNRRGTRSR